MRRLLYCLLAFCFGLFACSEEVSGPEPQMGGQADELATDPSFVCNEDPGTWVTLDGDAFSPLVVDAIASEHDDDAELPTVTLFLRADPTGADTDTTFSVTLDSPLGADDGRIRWIDDETLKLFISADLELPEGVYDIQVENPNGGATTEHEAFGVIPRPSLETAIPELTCVAQGERQINLEGDNLLVRGDDEQVPTIRLGDQEVEVVGTDNCRELHSTFTDHRLCQQVSVRLDEASFDAGVYQVSAENFSPAGCESHPEEDDVTVTIAPPPQAHNISPTPICSEQIGYEAMEIDGQDIVVVHDENGDAVYPEIHIDERSYEPISVDGCQEIESAPALGAQNCSQITIAVDDGDLAEQVADDTAFTELDVVITNPEPVGCHSTDDLALTAVPPPSVAYAEPDPMCTAQFENSFIVEGHGFVAIGDAQPVVHVGDQTYEVDEMQDCVDVPTPEAETISCERVVITIAEGDLEPHRADVVVENPETAACTSTQQSTVQVVAPPTVQAINPEPLCADQQMRTLEIDGEEFLDIDGALPSVAIGQESFIADDIADCQDLPVDDDGRSVRRCQTLLVNVDAGVLDAGLHDVVVTNPEQAACSSQQELDIETVPPPTLTSAEPRALCTTDGNTLLQVTGDHLYEVAGVGPEILVDGQTYQSDASDCTDVDGDTRLCETLEIDVDPSALSSDVQYLTAINPDPVGCQSDESQPITLADPPQIVLTEPEAGCEGEVMDADLTLMGQFTHDPDEDAPQVTMNGQSATVTGFSDCETTDLDDFTLETCTELHTTIPTDLRDQSFDVTVTGSDPVACGSDTITVEREPIPQIDAVVPERICDEGGSFEVQGQDLSPDAEFYLDGIAASTATIDSNGTTANVTFDGPLSPTHKTLEVVNPGDCSTIHTEEIRITEGPNPVYVDPPATFDGMTTQVTIYAAGLHGGSIEVVELLHPDGTSISLDYEVDDDRPNVVQAVVPEGILADTEDSVDFGVILTDDVDCSDGASDLLTVTSELTVAIDDITPPFGATDETTGVTIDAVDPLNDSDMVQFEAIPRAYLNPSDTEGDSTRAREIRSLQFIDETELNGLVPSGLPVGTYDLIVVNPDGAVGALFDSFEVTAERPPRIESVSPGSWTNDQDALLVDIEGENFRDDPEDPTVEVFCRAPEDDEEDEDLLDQPNDIQIASVSDTLVEILVDTNNLDHLDACYMRLTNADGTYDMYSPITVTNPAGNFVGFSAGTEFDTARRGPTTLSGVPSRQARYLYVIGGDAGTSDTAFRSGEFSRLDRFGAPGEWNYLPYELPTGRTLANGLRIDDFVYLVGGSDEGTATDEVLRAQVLDPLDVPEIVNLDLFADGDGLEGDSLDSDLDAGVYYYRVAAVFGPNDPANPDGESLASEPQPINVPLDGTTVSISWVAPEDINHDIDYYAVYRSVEADDPYGNESLIATVDSSTTSYTDDGTDDPIAGENPLPLGSFGAWDQVSTLQHERMVAGITSAQNPSDSDEHFIYVVGGEDGAGDFRDDYEFVSVSVDGPREQTVSADATLGELSAGVPNLLPGGRAELTAMTAYDGNASAVSDVDPQIFLAGGQSEGADSDNDIYVSTVNDDGHLDEWTQLPISQRLSGPNRYGHAGAVINNEVVVAGGADGLPDDTAYHNEIRCDVDDDCPPAELGPDWSSLSDIGMQERVWMGHLAFRGFWYLTGGLDTDLEPKNSVDFSVAGGAP